MANRNFSYENFDFDCSAEVTSRRLFSAKVIFLGGTRNAKELELPKDTDPYGSEAEAVRHAQQQAVRWVHDRTGDGQGRF